MKTIKLFMSRKMTMFLAALYPVFCYAQDLKISSLGEIEQKSQEGSQTILNIAKYVLGAALSIGLVFCIYALATNNPKAKEYLIGWIIAVVVILVGYLII